MANRGILPEPVPCARALSFSPPEMERVLQL